MTYIPLYSRQLLLGKLHDVNILDQLVPEPGATYALDRGYIGFDRLGRFHEAGSFFVIRAKSNLRGLSFAPTDATEPYSPRTRGRLTRKKPRELPRLCASVSPPVSDSPP